MAFTREDSIMSAAERVKLNRRGGVRQYLKPSSGVTDTDLDVYGQRPGVNALAYGPQRMIDRPRTTWQAGQHAPARSDYEHRGEEDISSHNNLAQYAPLHDFRPQMAKVSLPMATQGGEFANILPQSSNVPYRPAGIPATLPPLRITIQNGHSPSDVVRIELPSRWTSTDAGYYTNATPAAAQEPTSKRRRLTTQSGIPPDVVPRFAEPPALSGASKATATVPALRLMRGHFSPELEVRSQSPHSPPSSDFDAAHSVEDLSGLRGPQDTSPGHFAATGGAANDKHPLLSDIDTHGANALPKRLGVYALSDEDFVAHVQQALHARVAPKNSKQLNFALRQARRILGLLNLAAPPDDSEALFASEEEACSHVEPGVFFPGPIIVEGQQRLRLHTVDEFLAEYYNDAAEVYVQDPGAHVTRGGPHVTTTTMRKVKERFANKEPNHRPWNLLELAAHHEDGLRPAFLNGEDCRLLTKLKFPTDKDHASRRGYVAGWKEVEKWALVAQAGALTEPHQDSHGYNTYITINQGVVGFGWLSNPTEAERAAWRAAPMSFAGGRWRYVVLRPGQTVYFPSGTVHFVFRLPTGGNTLAFGGHVLRCSQISGWIDVLKEEKQYPDITNEDISVSAPAYLEQVERFVQQARLQGTEERWGGGDAIEAFLKGMAEFMQR